MQWYFLLSITSSDDRYFGIADGKKLNAQRLSEFS
jgi:hypothetical protein